MLLHYILKYLEINNASNLIIETRKGFNDKEKLTKEQVYACLKNGFIGYSEEEMNKILDQMINHGAEIANYLVEEDNKTVSVVRIFYSGRHVEHIIKDDLE